MQFLLIPYVVVSFKIAAILLDHLQILLTYRKHFVEQVPVHHFNTRWESYGALIRNEPGFCLTNGFSILLLINHKFAQVNLINSFEGFELKFLDESMRLWGKSEEETNYSQTLLVKRQQFRRSIMDFVDYMHF